MTLNLSMEDHPPTFAIETLIARHGAWRITGALFAVLIRRTHIPCLKPSDMSDHLRQDIGLTPEPKSNRHWDLRL